jgi:hypothetical protein
MQIALILEYQKSVNLHMLNLLHRWSRATRSFREMYDEATGSTRPWLRGGLAFAYRPISGTPV